ncbi:MAG TPA: transcription antitermination factor NusB [Gammaproteobacteria bacterium]
MNESPDPRNGKGSGNANRRRSNARRLAMQALYQHQISDDHWKLLRAQFHENPEFGRVDPEYFDELLEHCVEREDEFFAVLAPNFDRPMEQIDPVERAILLIGCYELTERPDIPYRVVINEGVELAKRFGAAEGHRYVNAILDRTASELRKVEMSARRR